MEEKSKLTPDSLFEEHIGSVGMRVVQAARFRYYFMAYETLFGAIARPPIPKGGNPRAMNPLHTYAENEAAETLVRAFNERHPGRMRAYLIAFLKQSDKREHRELVKNIPGQEE
ncbi:MAG: hypothetical protein WC641_04720 [Patescibacteria group bacterium]